VPWRHPQYCAPVFDTGIDWFRSTGSSNYNSLQASFEKRFAKGLQFQASYTYAHSLDIASNANLGPTQNNSDFRYFRDPQAEYGNSDFDVRNRYGAESIYELPFGHGKHFLGSANGFANQSGRRLADCEYPLDLQWQLVHSARRGRQLRQC
jgi:hypothetical protein